MTTAVAQMGATEARALTDQIKVAVEATWELVKRAYVERAWAVLGYDGWDDYCTREFGTSRLRLPREERAEVVASLRESGLSTRAIAAATGLSQKTVSREVAAGESNDSPVIGTDGKTYTPPARPTTFNDIATDRLRRVKIRPSVTLAAIGRGRYVWARIHGAGHNGHLRLLSLDDIVVVPNHAAQSEQVPGWLTVV